MAEPVEPALIRAPRCPICQRLTLQKFRPFCSKHCADVDLSRWLNGVYAVPERDEDEGDGRRPDDPFAPDA
jgi:endogenous inhibitor of DNA gyrase (YacG/DUF329 family)